MKLSEIDPTALENVICPNCSIKLKFIENLEVRCTNCQANVKCEFTRDYVYVDNPLNSILDFIPKDKVLHKVIDSIIPTSFYLPDSSNNVSN